MADLLAQMLQAIRGFTPEEMASFNVFAVTETYKKTLVHNGGRILGRLLRLQGSYLASVKRRDSKAKFNLRPYVERSIHPVFNVMMCRLQIYVSCYMERMPRANRDQVISRIVALMCEKLSDAINEEVRKTLC